MTPQEYLDSLELVQTPAPVIQYRAYYDATGSVTQYTTQQPPGDYIVVTAEQFAECNMNAIVKNGALVHPRNINRTYTLTKNFTDGVQTSKYDISILDSSTDFVYWKITTHDNT